MVLILPGLALLRDTTGHDWYAAGKLTLAETLIVSGFDRGKQLQFRTRGGETETLTRLGMMFQGEALVARSRIVSTAFRHAVLAIPAGAVLAVFLVAVQTYGRRRYGRRGEYRPREPRETASGAWNRTNNVKGLLMLDGMAPAEVVVVPPSGAGEPARVYGPPGGRAALPGAKHKSNDDAPRSRVSRALSAPAHERGHAQPGPARHDGPSNQLPVPCKPKPAARRGRERRKPSRPKPRKGKLWF